MTKAPIGHGPQSLSHRWPLWRSLFILHFFYFTAHDRSTKTPGVWNSWNAWHPYISAMKFPGFQNMSTSCLMATVSLCNRYTNWQMASFQSSDATVHKNITFTHSFTQFLLSQIHINCTINFFSICVMMDGFSLWSMPNWSKPGQIWPYYELASLKLNF